MGKLSLYKIPLDELSDGTHSYSYSLDNQFFKLIDEENSDLKKGSIQVEVMVKRNNRIFDFNFDLQGDVFVPCNRCLDELSIGVSTKNRMIVKFGKEYSEESDEIVIIPEDEGSINIAWFLFEFISLNIPIKHVHPQGECNREMFTKLSKHRAIDTNEKDEDEDDDEMEEEITGANEDNRWDSLKELNLGE